MRKRIRAAGITAAAFAAVLALGANPAAAAPTWTVTGGGSASGTATNFQVIVSGTGIISCSSTTLSGTAPSGSGLPGTALISFNSASWTGCTALGTPFTIAASDLPWKFNGSSYNSSTGTTAGTITGVEINLSSTFCSAFFAGTSATTPATLTGTYVNSTHTLTVTGGNLHVYDVVGCFGLLANGDSATYSAAYQTGTLHITSP